MDNPNDFIHIDEVFKRMKDREEPEGAGAWTRMKDLLDSEMPITAPIAAGTSSLRRYMIPLVALLLIGSGAAYYKLKGDKEDTGKAVSSFANKPESGNNSMGSSKGIVANATNDKQSTGSVKDQARHSIHAVNPSSDNKESIDKVAVQNEKTAIHKTDANKGLAQHKSLHAIADNPTAVAATSTPTKEGQKKSAVDKNTISPKIQPNAGNLNTAKGLDKRNSNTIAGKAGAGAGTLAPSNNNSADKVVAKAFEEQNVVESIYTNSKVTADNKQPNVFAGNAKKNTVPGMKVIAADWNNDKIVKDETNGSYYKEVRDTFQRIEMVERMAIVNSKNDDKILQKVVDTLAITRVERIKFTPLVPMEMAALRKAKIIPRAAANPIPMATKAKEYSVANEMVNLVPLANYKVASRKMDPSKFNQIVQNTTQGISNYFDGTNKFYAAILLGGNAFVGNPSAFGMQFGIAGLYQLSERLTLGAEIKFANHYFSNYTINDQAISYDNVTGQQTAGGLDWLFSGTQTTNSTAYRINSFSALEFPITLSYSLGRVSIFGGMNLSYSFPVKWDKTNTMSVSNVSSTESQNKNPFVGNAATMNEQKDFDPRMGMGYVAGFSYDVSRRISLDARMTQNLWTGYNGNARAVNELFKTPTFQFSIGYFFGRKERVVYIMDKR